MAVPDPGFLFYRWVSCSDDYGQSLPFYSKQNPAVFVLSQHENIVATFRPSGELFRLTFVQDFTLGGIPLDGEARLSGNYLEGEVIEGFLVRPHPGTGYVFDKWVIYSQDGTIIGEVIQGETVGTSFTMPPHDATFVAVYKEQAIPE